MEDTDSGAKGKASRRYGMASTICTCQVLLGAQQLTWHKASSEAGAFHGHCSSSSPASSSSSSSPGLLPVPADAEVELVEEGAQRAPGHAQHGHRHQLHRPEVGLRLRAVEDDEPAAAEETAAASLAVVHEAAHDHRHNGVGEEDTPQQGTAPPVNGVRAGEREGWGVDM